MKEYFRQEKLTLRYWPLNIIPRILFIAVMVLLPTVQWAFILLGTSISYGFRYTNEVEALLPLTDEEIRKMGLIEESAIKVDYSVNDNVQILGGPLNGYTGIVQEINTEKNKVKVLVSMFIVSSILFSKLFIP